MSFSYISRDINITHTTSVKIKKDWLKDLLIFFRLAEYIELPYERTVYTELGPDAIEKILKESPANLFNGWHIEDVRKVVLLVGSDTFQKLMELPEFVSEVQGRITAPPEYYYKGMVMVVSPTLSGIAIIPKKHLIGIV